VSGGLRAHLARVATEARALGRPLLAAWREPAIGAGDPLALFAAAPGERFFWSLPARTLALAACGAVAHVETAGATRFTDAAAAARALFADLRSAAAPGAPPAPAEASPLLVGGFAFAEAPSAGGPWAGWPALRFALPERCLARAGDTAWWTLCARVAPDSDPDRLATELLDEPAPARPDHARRAADRAPGFAVLADRAPEAYRRGVADALAAIAAGDLEKVVLARACRVVRRGGFEPARVLHALRELHPGCTAFAIGHGERAFVGATPERLLRREGDRVTASALAGSAPRGRTPAEDERLARALRESKKEQAEHEVVRRAIVAALAPACEALDAPEAPGLLRLDGIQHLHTPIAGRLRAGADGDLLALAGRLHPTPAVGGAPQAAARAYLTAHEELDRGGYAGGVGWLAPSGDGELAVALRCALLRGRRATLYAGAGIVAGSDPDAELAETRLKLRAALAALVDL
jgi:isochorismate synthase